MPRPWPKPDYEKMMQDKAERDREFDAQKLKVLRYFKENPGTSGLPDIKRGRGEPFTDLRNRGCLHHKGYDADLKATYVLTPKGEKLLGQLEARSSAVDASKGG